MKVFQQTQSTYDPEQSPRVYAEDRLEEPADDLLEVSASGYGDMVLLFWCDTAGMLVGKLYRSLRQSSV